MKMTNGTMEITLLAESKAKAAEFNKAKSKRKWAKLVEVKHEG